MGNNPSEIKGRTLPVEMVSWDDAQLFVQKLNQKTGKKYRLPSEAEWEYAARAGSTTTYPSGNFTRSDNSHAELRVYAWFGTNATKPVGLKEPNQFGLYDMIGNVWEWTQDCWNQSYWDAPTDGSAWMSGKCGLRVLRGGSWSDVPSLFRSAYRYTYPTSVLHFNLGFRVVRDL